MYRHREFHDSYYYHTCLIIPEKDVLETDIVGTGCATRIRRWWHDFFLLSYTCERSRSFYTSSHAMRIERFRQFRKYRHRIHPMSKFRNLWDFLILHVFIMNKILFRFTSTFIFENLPLILFYLGVLFEMIIIADLYVSLKTGYVDTEAKRVILKTKRSLLNFCTKKLFIHFASASPLHCMMFLRYGKNITCGLCKTNKFICALKIISFIGLFRVLETSAYWTQKRRSAIKTHIYKFIRIGAIAIVTMIQFYDLSEVTILLVFMRDGQVADTSLLGLRAGFKYSNTLSSSTTNYMYVCYDISRMFKSSLLFSLGIKSNVYYLDKITAFMAFCLAKLFYAWSLLECYNVVGRIVYPEDRMIFIKTCAINIVKCRHLSDTIKTKVEQYFDFRPSKLKSIERKNELYRMLPQILKEEAMLNSYMTLIMRIPFFTDLPLPVLKQIVLLLQTDVYLNNDVILEAGGKSNGLMIVDNGVLAVYTRERKEIGHLIDGDYFGQLSLVTDKELCMSYVVAISACTILLLEKNDFRTLMRDHPKLFNNMKIKMKLKYGSAVDKSQTESDVSGDQTPKVTKT